MSKRETHPQPSPEWIAREVLWAGLRQMFGRTLARGRPLAKWRIPHLGTDVYAEVLLLPSLEVVLRVRDDATDEVLAQSEPNSFNTVDMQAVQAAQLFRDWRDARAPGPNRGDGASPAPRA